MKLKRPPQPTYKVGYKNPPRTAQFKKGESGNPNGRPKKVPSLLDALSREADRKIKVQIGRTVQTMTKRDVLARKLIQLAMDGQMQAARLVIELLSIQAGSEKQNAGELASEIPDDETVRQIIQRLTQQGRS